ncbi:MAG: sulfatase-like hydrolase/transferase [Cyclobacteriaceae bacterium]|nr:sulfatase-like hydrolase/transferase [Cyclobacteriaceae bacterium]MDH4297225.1 sulfatase-like hydrolase/transferase [Cyclobacteriaceae bacterium]MDH5251255.1 sulfatase-like hydrolase/transferase [Cyclobacteriaceae bacterium]
MKSAHFNLLVFPLLLVTMTSFGGKAQQKSEKPPNIIFILTDDLGYGDVGAFYQNQRRKENKRNEPSHFTPNIDLLAASGARLTQQYCNAPVCAPSRASLLLGVHQGHANVRDNQFDKALADNHTLATVLRQAGYATVAVGKWGLQGEEIWEKGSAWKALPLDRGFDNFFGYVRHVDGHEHYPKEGLYRGAKEVYNDLFNISSVLDKCYTGDLWTAYAKQWIVNHKQSDIGEKPFFMYLAYDIPHAVLELPTQAYPAGAGLNGGIQWKGEEGHMINTASGVIDSYVNPDYALATYDNDNNPATAEVSWPGTYKRYATVVRRIDDAVGDIRHLLIDMKIDGNTIIVFTSDNGPSRESYLPNNYATNEPTFFNSFGPFDGIKRDVWEGGVRMPAIVSWPAAIPGNSVVTTPSMFSDWMATFCDAAGIVIPAESDGVSLLPSLTGKGKQRESTVYVEYYNDQKTPNYEEFESGRRGRTRNQMQLIRLGDQVGVRYDIQSANDDFEIYNVVADPKEKTNLAARPEMDFLQQKMKERVLRLRRPDTSAVRPYDEAFVPAVIRNNLKPGITWKAFKGDFPWIPQVYTLESSSAGQAIELAPSVLKKVESLLVCEGYFKIPEDAVYTFSIKAKGKALLRIHEATVIDADYGYDSGASRAGIIKLSAGVHPFTLYYKKGTVPTANFNIYWSGPGFKDQPIPATILFHD